MLEFQDNVPYAIHVMCKCVCVCLCMNSPCVRFTLANITTTTDKSSHNNRPLTLGDGPIMLLASHVRCLLFVVCFDSILCTLIVSSFVVQLVVVVVVDVYI